ncbi:MAG: precorrin-6y C5,15-methyltransferase (decarboxylating) subunit CbiE [Desulfobacterota bacterium]|nr:precorrin-6y C5,15-methyltransferase (decarboxylating) subunit CbiE [Thermodesulfobacteriota bacterium]
MGLTPTIAIVGCGPGHPDYLTAAAVKAVALAEVLVGAQRLLDLFPQHPAEMIRVDAKIEQVLEAITLRAGKRVAVLVTGDPGLASLAKPIIRRFGPERCRIIPGISSVQAAFARLGLDWLDARIIDAHGKDPDPGADTLTGAAKIAVLGGRARSFEWLKQTMGDRLRDYEIHVCEDLTLDSERITDWQPGSVLERTLSSRTIFILVKRG